MSDSTKKLDLIQRTRFCGSLKIPMLADCHPLGGILYRKWHMYNMAWGDDHLLENYIMCGAPFGGPIAMITDNKKIASHKEIKEKIMIFTSAGDQLATIDWDGSNIVGMGWSDHEDLVTVNDSGIVRIFDITGKAVRQFSLVPTDSPSALFLECHFWGNGVAAISTESIVYVAEGFSALELATKGPRTYTLRTGLGIDRSYTSMTIIPPQFTSTGLLEVLLGTSDNSILVLYEAEFKNVTEDQQLQGKIYAPVVKMAVAPNGVCLACYRSDGVLTVMDASFSKKVLDFDAKSVSRPIEIAWCGDDSVVMQWRNTGILMVGPFGDWLNFPYDSSMHLIAELDCCRIVTAKGCEILHRVLPSTVAIRSVGSTDPAALMFDAMEAFEEGDPKSDENIRSIAASNQLVDAVQACVLSAAGEFDVSHQQALLKAASYGKAFCPDADPAEFVNTAHKLRVLNEVRKPSIGLPLTFQQYNRLTPEVLVARLTMRNHHFLALKICELLKLKNERVLIHWACEKVRKMSQNKGTTDEEINFTLRKMLDPHGRVSYLSIAEAAYSMGRRQLATYILDREQHPGEQIPLLLRNEEVELALQKAISSQDTDLIYFTLISLEQRIVPTRGMDAFLKLCHNHPEAANLLKIYRRNKVTADDRTKLHELLMHSKNYFEAGIAAANQAFQQKAPANKVSLLKEAAYLFGQGKDTSFIKSATDDEVELLEAQRNLELRCQSKQDFVGLGVMQTIEKLVFLSVDDAEAKWATQEIANVVKRYKVSEKSLYYTKIHCYSKRGAWELLQRLAQEKKSPVGYKPFARATIDAKLPLSEVEQYIERISVPEDKYLLYMELKVFWKAMEVASKLRSAEKLKEIGRLCKDQSLERQIIDMLNRM